MQKSKLWSTWHSSSYRSAWKEIEEKEIWSKSSPKYNEYANNFKIIWKSEAKEWRKVNETRLLTFVSIERVSWSWKCSLSFDFPSSLEPRNCENLYCQMTAGSAPSVSEKPDCQSSVKPPPRPWCDTAKVLRCWVKREHRENKGNRNGINFSSPRALWHLWQSRRSNCFRYAKVPVVSPPTGSGGPDPNSAIGSSAVANQQFPTPSLHGTWFDTLYKRQLALSAWRCSAADYRTAEPRFPWARESAACKSATRSGCSWCPRLPIPVSKKL